MGLEQRLALRIVLARELVVVPGGAVGFDDETLGRPAEVRYDAPAVEYEVDVHVRMRQPAAEHEVEHRVLELASCRRRPGRDDPCEVAHAAAWAEPTEHFGQLTEVDAVQGLRLTYRAPQRSVRHRGREVQQGPCR
jgi:hypothetical protein